MTKKNAEELIGDEEIDVGEVVKKKEKKRKSKEEKTRDRKVVFWILLLVVLMTAVFWLKAMMSGEGVDKNSRTQELENSSKKDINQIDEGEKESGFFVKYKI